MEIVYKTLGELTPYENNPRHNDNAVEYVKNSIERFGFKVPMVIDKNNVIVAGHTRYKAALELDMAKVPCVVADDLTDDEIRAFRLADNKVAEFAEWDIELRNEELEMISMDMEQFGFDMSEISIDDREVEEDDYDFSEEVETRCQLGDLWKLGNHRLICGDSTDVLVVDRLMDGVKADMVFTDPPYGMNLDTDFSGMQNHLDFAKEKGFTGGKKYEQGKVDEFYPEMIDAIFQINADEMFLWGADYFAELIPNKNNGSWIVWDKRANGNDDIEEDYSSDKMYGSCFELCWSKKKHKRDIARVKWAGVFGKEQEFDHKRYHPTQKPTNLAGWFLKRYSSIGESVIDLFGGSGSTLIACEQLDRRCFMVELDPHYCDVIITRWENFTGEKAVKIDG